MNSVKKFKFQEVFTDLLIMTVGNFLLAFAVTTFILPLDILSGGVAGIAVALFPLTNWSPQIVINVLVIGMFAIGYLLLGKDFAIKTVYSSFCYPIMLSLMAAQPNMFPQMTENVLLASIYGGLIGGVGIGLVLRRGASTGGMDVPPLLLKKYAHLELSKGIMFVDALTILLGVVAFNIDAVLIGLISAYCTSAAVNTVLMFGGHDAKSVQIISDSHQKIIEEIHLQLDRGSTLIPITGGYSQQSKMMVLVVITKNQYPKLNSIVHNIDPHAFMIVSNTMEVKGLGFSFEYKV